jgi:hypothetical protein
MRRAFGYAGAWAVVTSTAAGVSWYGCTLVLDESSSGPPPSVLAAVGAGHGPPPDQTTTATKTARPRPRPTRATAPAAPRTAPAPHASRSSRSPFLPPATPTNIRHATPPTHAGHPLPPGRLPAATSPSSPADPTALQLTCPMAGGTATLRFSPGESVVQVISLTPAPGYRVYLNQSRPDELTVSFVRSGRESDLLATWNGEASTEVTEYSW